MSQARDDDTIAVDSLTETLSAPSRQAALTPATRSVLAGRYELSAMLGAGGMGTVFRARDLELEELVAIKVLNPDLSSSPELIERFKAEVKLARRVTHHNVARTFDFGIHEELRFLSMEYVDGLSLDDRIAQSPKLELREIMALTETILQGLMAAHGAGVVHRDLKPANVMLARDGRVVLMDFGIARALEVDEHDRRTKNGVVGTPLYMSPEQVEGARDLDGRSDLYSLGLMVHEMLTGKVPFEGAGSAIAVAAARLTKPPPPFPVAFAPAWFAALVDSMLATHRDGRPASAERALREFARSSGALHAADPQRSLFVEPKEHSVRLGLIQLAAPERVAHVAHSLTEELAELLASTPKAQVMIGVQLPGETPRSAGSRLGVDVVVEGAIEESEGEFSVRVRLVTVSEGLLLSAARIRGPLSALPRWLEQTADTLAKAIESKLEVAPREEVDPLTLDLYYRGRAEFNKRWRDSALRARALLSQAYERAPQDPQIVSAYALLLTRLFGFQQDVDEDLAERMVRRAQELAPGRADSLMARASLHFQVGETEACVDLLRQILERSPQHSDALDLLGRIFAEVGPEEEARRVIALTLAVDPSQISLPAELARLDALAGDWTGAETNLVLSARNNLPAAYTVFARHRMMHVWRRNRSRDNDLAHAVESNESGFSESERATVQHLLRATTHAEPELLSHLPQMLRAILQTAPRQRRRAAFNAQLRAEVLAFHELWPEVIEALQDADRAGLFDLLWLEQLPLFSPLRGRPEFEAVRAGVRARAATIRARMPSVGAR